MMPPARCGHGTAIGSPCGECRAMWASIRGDDGPEEPVALGLESAAPSGGGDPWPDWWRARGAA